MSAGSVPTQPVTSVVGYKTLGGRGGGAMLGASATGGIIRPGSAVVGVYDPPTPIPPPRRYNCPHQRPNLVSFHDTSLWPNNVCPAAGMDFSLPANTHVILWRNANTFGQHFGVVTVPPGSALIIGENISHGVSIAATGFIVRGSFLAGSSTCRLSTRLTITLHGTRPSTRAALDALPAHAKGISVTGQLELHGQLYHRTWTRLARRVQPGDTSVLLQAPVNWVAGQQVVLTTTALKDSREWHRNEVLTLTGQVTPPHGFGSALNLATPATHAHEANDAWQGEVGLLSRSIIVQGAAGDSEPTDTSPLACADSDWYVLGSTSKSCNNHKTGYGAHVRAAGAAAVLRLSGVELRRVGQTNVLGRYPVHFHMMGDVAAPDGGLPRALVRDCAIHRSYYRCVSVHGTNRSLVSTTVAYDAVGHCYYLEDGVEEYNTFEYNLAAHVHWIGGEPGRSTGQTCASVDQTDDLLNPADVTASGFYVTNAQNTLVGNAASGGWAGFAFPNLPFAIKLHKSAGFVPMSRDLLRFEGYTPSPLPTP